MLSEALEDIALIRGMIALAVLEAELVSSGLSTRALLLLLSLGYRRGLLLGSINDLTVKVFRLLNALLEVDNFNRRLGDGVKC